MIVLDTTVLIYAVGAEHPLREPCRSILAAHGEGRIEATTTIEVVQEFVHVRARRRSRSDAVTLARRFAEAFDLIAISGDDLQLGLQLFEHHPRIGAFDAVLAAAALTHGAEALVSADQAFGAIPALPWMDPAAPALQALLSS
jgi:predicted nucleic acid-binding protein